MSLSRKSREHWIAKRDPIEHNNVSPSRRKHLVRSFTVHLKQRMRTACWSLEQVRGKLNTMTLR